MSSRRSRRASSWIETNVSLDLPIDRASTAVQPALNLNVQRQLRGRSADELELFRQRAEVAQPVLADDDQVLDPDAKAARQVDAGLDGGDLPRGEDVVGALREPRALVDLEADPVPERVAEVLAVPGAVDHPAGSAVDVLALDPGGDRLQPGLLGLPHHLVDRARLL